MNILIVDDKELAALDLKDELEEINNSYRCTLAFSSKDALELAKNNSFDVAFLDIEMPESNGIDLASKLQAIKKNINIIFVTGHSEYAIQALELYVSGFLIKPASKREIKKALENLRYPVGKISKRIKINCFGTFAAFVDGKPLEFKRKKTLELLAFLVDQRGIPCSNGSILSVLWEDAHLDDNIIQKKSYLRTLIADLRNTFSELGLSEFIIKTNTGISINTGICDCDYYNFLDRDPIAISSYKGLYMVQYSWGEYTNGNLMNMQ